MNEPLSDDLTRTRKSKILLFVGTRPEAIKLVPLYLELKAKFSHQCEVKIICTGQHKEMVNQILDFFSVTPDLELDIMTRNQSLADLTSMAVKRVDQVLFEEKPEIAIVQGDTTTAFCAALAAFYRQIKIAHVEAGLRTYDLRSPFPEEANRQFISKLADLHFAATNSNQTNLLKEGIREESIAVVGNTVIDTLILCTTKLRTDPALRERIANEVERSGYVVGNRKYALITGHRRESFGTGFQHICRALAHLANAYPEIDWVYPVHLNPNVREVVHSELGAINNIYLIPPMHYGAFVFLMQEAFFIITDSGGVQEEAPSLRKPVFVMREKTERMEGVGLKLVKMVGTVDQDIIQQVSDSIAHDFQDFALDTPNPYGTGQASAMISKRLLNFLADQN